MQIDVRDSGAFASVVTRLEAGESFVSESGAMFRASSNVDIDVTTRARGSGGLLGGLKRVLASESFFFSTYRTTDGQPGEVGLAPTHLGDVRVMELDTSSAWVCTGGSYLGSTSEVQVDTQFQGLKGLLSGESLSFLRLSGQGQFVVAAFGRMVEMSLSQPMTVDTGHVVAFEDTLSYTVTKAGQSWLQSWLSGEGFVLRFTGTGRILVQSHNPSEFGRRLGPKLPPRS